MIITETMISNPGKHVNIDTSNVKTSYCFCRLTPVYAVAILIWTTLYRHWIWNGPFTTQIKKFHPSTFDYCNKYWWTNILYINNFHPSLGNLDKQVSHCSKLKLTDLMFIY
jgi:hypothetical protein